MPCWSHEQQRQHRLFRLHSRFTQFFSPAKAQCAGYFSDVAGSPVCKLCQQGQFSASGASSCTSCAVGRFASKAASSTCHPCARTRARRKRSHSRDSQLVALLQRRVKSIACRCDNRGQNELIACCSAMLDSTRTATTRRRAPLARSARSARKSTVLELRPARIVRLAGQQTASVLHSARSVLGQQLIRCACALSALCSGKFAPVNGSTSCQSCAPGKYSNLDGQSAWCAVKP